MNKILISSFLFLPVIASADKYGGAGMHYSNYTDSAGSGGGMSTFAIIVALVIVVWGIYMYFKGE